MSRSYPPEFRRKVLDLWLVLTVVDGLGFGG